LDFFLSVFYLDILLLPLSSGKAISMSKTLKTCLLAFLLPWALFPQGASDFTYLKEHNSGLPDNRIYCSYIDMDGCMWFGTHVGLVRYFGTGFKLYLEGEIIKDIVEDAKNNLWIAAWGGGLHRLNRITENIKTYKHEMEMANPMACNTLSSLVFDEKGKLWIGNGNCGLHVFDPVSETFKNFSLNDLHLKPGYDKYFDNSVEDMLMDEDGRVIWLAAQNGIYKFDIDNERVIRRDTFFMSGRTPFLTITKGNPAIPNLLWTGTFGVGICSYDKTTGEIIHYAPNK
jgi:ligand-binding sensor domain-containing protein